MSNSNHTNDQSENKQENILNAPKIIQMAREHALLGYYAESLMKYKVGLSLIQK